jgi:peroxin-12
MESERLLETLPPFRRFLFQCMNQLKTVIPSALLLLRFMDWWQSSGYAQSLQDEDVLKRDAIPAPPSATAMPEMQIGVMVKKDMCPICKRTRSNPCQLTTSGYVFCYPCIHSYVELYFQCPVTMKKVDVSDPGLLRKIYDNE